MYWLENLCTDDLWTKRLSLAVALMVHPLRFLSTSVLTEEVQLDLYLDSIVFGFLEIHSIGKGHYHMHSEDHLSFYLRLFLRDPWLYLIPT